MNFLGLGPNATIEISLDSMENRKLVEVKTEEARRLQIPVFHSGESISGVVTISLKRNSKVEYQGIKIEFIGLIDFFADRGSRDEFVNRTQDLARPGILSETTTYPFKFTDLEKPFESYSGSSVQLRYFLRVTVVKRFMDLTKEQDILVHSFFRPAIPDDSIQMEVGIEDSLHIEFEYNKSCYHLEDVIIGKIYFLLVRVKIKYMEIQILRRESTGIGVNTFSDQEALAKFEIMDGAPVRGESIPIRIFLSPYNLSPTMREVNRKFSVRYFLNLVLLDEEERRYYKQHEIVLYRKSSTHLDLNMTATHQSKKNNLELDHPSSSELNEDNKSPLSTDSSQASPIVHEISSMQHYDDAINRDSVKRENGENDIFHDIADGVGDSAARMQRNSSSPPNLTRAERSTSRYEPEQPRRSSCHLPEPVHKSKENELDVQKSPNLSFHPPEPLNESKETELEDQSPPISSCSLPEPVNQSNVDKLESQQPPHSSVKKLEENELEAQQSVF